MPWNAEYPYAEYALILDSVGVLAIIAPFTGAMMF